MNLFQNKSEPFKKCSACDAVWQSRDEFLSDIKIKLIGYQVSFDDLLAGYFLFNHDCGTTLAILVAQLESLYDGPVFATRLTGTDQCPGYCLHQDQLDPCVAECECVFVREVIQIVKDWPKVRTE